MSKAEFCANYHFPEACIQIFTRAPIKGQVKTRLGECLSADQILTFYKDMLDDVITSALDSKVCPVELRVAMDVNHDFFLPYIERGVSIKPQSNGDLGQRMAAAFEDGLDEKEFVIAIGGDCVSIDGDYLLSAAKLLAEQKEVVIGPAEDGGYVLVGMKRFFPDLFRDIPWGSDRVLSLSTQKLEQLHINYKLLGLAWDVDTPEDYQRYLKLLGKSKTH